ncbi:MAG: hypothetical protein IJM51_03465 [Clostridia bacterium]|nr:hypothetical protein [Clostridia bacterium]
MKATKRLITLTAVVALLLSMVSCTALQKKANFTQTITAGNIEVTVRNDMKEDPSITEKADTYITCYFWSGYGMNVGAVPATEIKFSGKNADQMLMETLAGQKDLTELQKYGDIAYAEYTTTDSGKEYLFTDFILDMGDEYYFLEFYTMSKTSAKYMDEYKTIVSSVKKIQELPASVDATINGIALTLDGDAKDSGNNTYLCGRYMVSAYAYDVPAGYSAKEFCNSLVQTSGYKTAEGQAVTEINTTDDGVSSFECYINEMNAYHYAKVEGKKLLYVFFFTVPPADDALKADFAAIAAGAKLA